MELRTGSPPPSGSSRHADSVDYLFHCADLTDGLKVVEFSAVEELNRPYEVTVHLEALDEFTDLHKLLGRAVSVELRRNADYTRLFCGVVDRVRIADDGTTHQTGVVRIVPALALMALRRNSRIFQGQSAYEIIVSMLTEGLAPYRRTFSADGLIPANFITRNYCVQYRETDLDFVQRLMEEEGIGYCFDVTGDAVERVVLFDHSSRAHHEVGHHLGLVHRCANSGGSRAANGAALVTSQRAFVHREARTDRQAGGDYCDGATTAAAITDLMASGNQVHPWHAALWLEVLPHVNANSRSYSHWTWEAIVLRQSRSQ